MTMAAFARRRGVSRKTVTIWAQRGRIPTVGPRKLIDPIAAERALASSGQVAGVVATVLGDDESVPAAEFAAGSSLTKLKAETEAERGQLLRLERLEREGKLVPADRVLAEAEIAARQVRQALDGLPSFAEDLTALAKTGDVLGVRRALRQFVRDVEAAMSRAMAEAADQLEAERQGGDDGADDGDGEP
jgi:hypothetical protein